MQILVFVVLRKNHLIKQRDDLLLRLAYLTGAELRKLQNVLDRLTS